MTDPVDLLRRAAEKLRSLAEDSTPGPWWSDDSEDSWRLHGVGMRIPAQLDGLIPEQIVNKQILKAPKHSTPYAEYWPNAFDAELITTMGPPVALALADWLDAEADGHAAVKGVGAVLGELMVQVSRSEFGAEIKHSTLPQAEALARAVLREPDPTGGA